MSGLCSLNAFAQKCEVKKTFVFLYIPVANKWIHEYGQEFQHRCSLNPDEWEGWSSSWAPFRSEEPASTIERHPRRQREVWSRKSEHTDQGKGREPASVIGAPGAPGSLKHTVHCCSGHGSHKAKRRGRRGVGQLAISPQRPNVLLLLLASSCRWREASAFGHWAGFSKLSNWHLIQPFAYTGPTRGSVVTNQHGWTLCRLSEL